MMTAAIAKHPNPDFSKNITKQIMHNIINKYDGLISNSPIQALLTYVAKFRFAENLSNVALSNDLFIQKLITNVPQHTTNINLLQNTSYLDTLEESDFTIPADLINPKNSNAVVNLTSNSHIVKDAITPEITEQILAFNIKMEETYNQLSAQLTAIVKTIDSCKTTKQFKSVLPELIGFYPDSVVRKLNAKNEIDEDLTEEQQLLQSAMTSIATGKMLDSANKP
jgi:hypothetical protein